MTLFSATSRERRRAVRVGLFLLVGLVLAGLIVFLIGKETRLFEEQVLFRTYFANVEGLTEQSPVWLGGLEVGRVEGVRLPAEAGERRLEVRLRVASRHASRVREDSVARLASLGVLGEKAVDITLGSPDKPPIPPGGVIPSAAGGDLSSLMRSAAQVMQESEAITRALRAAVEVYANPELARDVAGALHSLRVLLEEVEKGEGVLHTLIYDKEAGRNMGVLLAKASRLAARMDASMGHVEALLAEVHQGNGTAHQLIYGGEGAQALRGLGEAAGQLAELIEGARQNPQGALHQLVYGDTGNLLADLGSAAADLKAITSTVARGEGSLGGLIQDPTVYEDLRTLLGNVKRNRVLRALVRFAIRDREGELEKVGQPREMCPPQEAPREARPPSRQGRREPEP